MQKIITIFFILILTTAVFAANWDWKEKAPYPSTARHRSFGISIGAKGYLGMGHINSGGLSGDYYDWWEYDPATNSWTQKADYPGAGRYGCAGFVINNKAYIGTGNSQGMGSQSDFYEYNPVINTWTQKTSFPSPCDGGIGFSINGIGYLGGTYGSPQIYQYDATFNSWSPSPITLGGTGEYGCSFVINNKAYMLFSSGTVFYEFDPATSTLNTKAPFPGGARFGAGAFAINNKGYVCMGADAGYNDYKDSWVYDPQTNVWDTLKSFPGQKRHYIASFSIADKGYLGTGSNGTNLGDFWEYGWRPDAPATGIQENINSNLKIFPNPSSNIINIVSDQNIDQIEVYNCLGALLLDKKNINNSSMQLNISEYKSGIYELKCTTSKGYSYFKFIKN